MGYREAVLVITAEAVQNAMIEKYGKRKWGIYTAEQSDAKALAVTVGVWGPPEVHGINYIGHYHDSQHKFHIWFGLPIP